MIYAKCCVTTYAMWTYCEETALAVLQLVIMAVVVLEL